MTLHFLLLAALFHTVGTTIPVEKSSSIPASFIPAAELQKLVDFAQGSFRVF